MDFRVLPTKDCISYLDKFDLTVDDVDTSLSISSGFGLVYSLPNKEVVLIPTRIGLLYEGFIFKDVYAFNKMNNNDYFPISRKLHTVWELERVELANLPNSIEYFKKLIESRLDTKIECLDKDNTKLLYGKLVEQFYRYKNNQTVQQLMLAYSVLVMDFLVREKGAEWKFSKRYEIYNSYVYPYVELEGELKMVHSILSSTLSNPKGDYFSFAQRVGL
jgi:hypothetical protein